MKKYSTLRRNIMMQVYFIYALRKIFSIVGASFILGVFSSFEILTSVSIKNVLANMPSLARPNEVLYFHVAAFEHTGHVVQVSLLALFTAILLYTIALIKELAYRDTGIVRI